MPPDPVNAVAIVTAGVRGPGCAMTLAVRAIALLSSSLAF